MMINFDRLAGFDLTPVNGNGSGKAELRNNGWLFELERAWLDSEGGKAASSEENFLGSGKEVSAEPSPTLAALPTSNSIKGKENSIPLGKIPSQTLNPEIAFIKDISQRSEISGAAFLKSAIFDSGAADRESSISFGELPYLPEMQPSPGQSFSREWANQFPATEASAKTLDSKTQSISEENEPYSQSRLHLVEDEQGARVWIRDAALPEDSAYKIVQALGTEFNAAGIRLIAMTLNGKDISLGTRDRPARKSAESLSDKDINYVQDLIQRSNLPIRKLSQEENF